MSTYPRVGILLSGLSLVAACSGTDTGNPPVIGFGNSGCHDQAYGQGLHESASTGLILQSLDMPTLVPDAQYKGLTCLAWQRVDASSIRILLTNYESGCGSELGWVPKAELLDDGTLDLVLEDSDCSQASCGWCLYDLSFTIELKDRAADGPVRMSQRGCQVDALETKHAVLALASQPSGAVCNYANSSALTWKGGDDGSKRMPCGAATGAAGAVTCQAGLQCIDLGTQPAGDFSGGARCLPSCSSDADCDALSSCQAGVCKLRATGLSSERTQ